MTQRDEGFWRRVDSKFKYLAPIFLVLLSLYLYSSLVEPIFSSKVEKILLIVVFCYFILELVIKYLACANYKIFLKEYWLEIIENVAENQRLQSLDECH